MKYRIIQEVDGNGHTHFELELWKRGIFGYRWKAVEGYRDEFSFKRKFDSMEEVMKCLNRMQKTRSIVKEGDIEVA